MTFIQWVGAIGGGGAFWALFGFIAYTYAQNPYKWSKKVSLLFALGGPITGVGAVYDVWLHTSMMGSYTRDWGKNPGEHVVSWRELEGKGLESRVEKAIGSLTISAGIGFQGYAGFSIWHGLTGENVFTGTFSYIAGSIGIVWLSIGLFLLLYDAIGTLTAIVNGEDAFLKSVLLSELMVMPFFIELIALGLLALVGFIVYGVSWLLRAVIHKIPELAFG